MLSAHSFRSAAIAALTLFLVACGGGETGKENANLSIVSFTPAQNAKDVPVDVELQVTLSEAVDEKTVNLQNFSLLDPYNNYVSGTFFTDGVKLGFKPATTLNYATTYSATVTKNIASGSGKLLDKDNVWRFTTVANQSGAKTSITHRSPEADATDVPLNQAISITFSEFLHVASLSNLKLLNSADEAVPVAISYSGKSVLLRPTTILNSNVRYKIRVDNVNDASGNPIATQEWSFNSGATPDNESPVIINRAPLENAENVAVASMISIEFSEVLNPGAATASQIQVINTHNQARVEGRIAFTGKKFEFYPSTSLSNQTTYEVRLNGVEDLARNRMPASSWRFTTRELDETPPTVVAVAEPVSAQRVSLNSSFVIEFSENVDIASIKPDQISLTPAASGSVEIVDKAHIKFTPSTSLLEKTSYTLVVKQGVKDEEGNIMSQSYSWPFKTEDVTAPKVSSVSPSVDAVNIGLRPTINVTFSEAVNVQKLLDDKAFVMEGVEGELTASGSQLTFKPKADLAEQTSYLLKVKSNLEDLEGNILGQDFAWSFSTGDFTRPTVVSTAPENDASGVSATAPIRITFNEDIDPETAVVGSSIILISGGGLVSSSVMGNVLTLTPIGFSDLKTYSIFLTSGIRDNSLNKNSLVESFFTFETSDSNPPVVSAYSPAGNNQNTNTEINVVFSEAVNTNTISKSTFIVRVDSTKELVAGNLVAASNSAFFKPASSLKEGTIYEVLITNGIRDTSGNALTAHTWKFTTGDFTPPQILNRSPDISAESVIARPEIRVSFNEAINPTSITNSSFYITTAAGVAVPGANAKADPGSSTTAIITLSQDLKSQTGYRVTLTSGVKDAAGNSLQAVPWSFTTGDFSRPQINSFLPTGNRVSTGETVSVIFSENMRSDTVNSNSFVVRLNDTKVAVSGSLDVRPNNAIFTPASNLVEKETYEVLLTSNIKDLAGNSITSMSWTFSIGDFTAPSILTRSPGLNEVGIGSLPTIEVGFSESIKSATLNAASFNLTTSNGDSIETTAPVFSNNNSVVSITPLTNLLEKTSYRISLTNAVEDISGNQLPGSQWLFTTNDFTAPLIVKRFPDVNQQGIGRNVSVAIDFDDEIDESSLAGNVTVIDIVSGAEVLGLLTVSKTDLKKVEFNPDADYTGNHLYQINVGTGVRNKAGIAFSGDFWNFQTGDFTAPTVKANTQLPVGSNVLVNSNVSVTFNETIDQNSIDAASFLLSETGSTTYLAGVFEKTATSVSFNPTVNLKERTSYIVSLTAGIKDTAGNALEPFQWTFNTGDFTGPKVIGPTVPRNNAENIKPGDNIIITFDEPINASTVTGNVGLSGGAGSLSASVDGSILTLTPSGLEDLKSYIVTLGSGIKDLSVNANAMSGAYTLSFITGDYTGPAISSYSPAQGFDNVNRAISTIDVSFNEAIDINSVIVNSSSVPKSVIIDGDAIISNPRLAASGRVLTLDVSGLVDSKTYNLNLTTDIKDASVNRNALENTQTLTFKTGDFSGPLMESTIPAAGVKNVNPDSDIVVLFSEPVDIDSIAGNLSISGGPGSLSPSVAGTTLVLKPTGFADSTAYTILLGAGITDTSPNSNVLGVVETLSFETGDYSPPKVTAYRPAQGAIKVNPSLSTIDVTFSEAIDINTVVVGSLNAGENSVLIDNGASITSRSLDATNTVLTLHISGLVDDQTYTLTLTSAITDLSPNNNNLTGIVPLTFSTGDFTAPLLNLYTPAGIDVDPASAITITFNENMNTSTINDATFQLKPQGGAVLPAVVTPGTRTSTLTPASRLVDGVAYEIILSSGIKDVAGNLYVPLSTPTFTTGDYTGPSVLSEALVGGTNNIDPREKIIVNFNQDIASGSVNGTNVTITGGATLGYAVSGSTLTLTPTGLVDETAYTISISGITDTSARQNVMAGSHSIVFTTGDYTKPKINGSSSLSGSKSATLGGLIDIPFTEGIDLGSVTAASVFISGTGTALVQDHFDSMTNTLYMKPSGLVEKTNYTVTVTTSITDDSTNKNTLGSDYVFSFTTGDFTSPSVKATSPANGDSGVIAASAQIKVEFSENLAASTIDASKLDLKRGSTSLVINTLSYTDEVVGVSDANFVAGSDPLQDNTRYTARVFSTVTDVAGNNLAGGDYVWSFTTGSLRDITGVLSHSETINVNSDGLYVVAGLTTGTDFLVSLKGADGNVDLYVYNDAFATEQCHSVSMTSNNEYCVAQPSDAGELYIKVAVATTTTSYTLNVQPKPVVDASLSVGASPLLQTVPQDEVMLYQVNLTQAGVHQVQITNVDTDANLYVYDNAFQTLVCSSSNAGTLSEQCFIDTVDSDLYVLVEGNSSSAAGFNLNVKPLATDVHFVEGTGLVGGESQYHHISVLGNTEYTVSLTGLADNLNLEIYSDLFVTPVICSGLPLAGLDNEICVVTTPASGELYVKVSNAGGTSSGYTLDVTETLGILTLSGASGLPLSSTLDLGGNMYYRITGLTPAGSYTVATTNTTDDLDMHVSVDGFVSEVCPVAATTGDEICSFNANTQGEVFIWLDGVNLTAPTDFTLNVN